MEELQNLDKETLDIISMITTNPIISLNDTYKSKLAEKIKSKFSSEQQKMYMTSLFCSVNYSQTKDFIINFDDVWKWVGYDRKGNAKTMLTKNFREDVDFKIGFSANTVKPKSKDLGGRPEETIMLNIRTFKKFCLKARTKQADKIHDYYILLEEMVNETIKEESDNLKNILTIQNEENGKLEQLVYIFNNIKFQFDINDWQKKETLYLIQLEGNIYKFGISADMIRRISAHKKNLNENLKIIKCWDAINRTVSKKIEDNIKDYTKHRGIQVKYKGRGSDMKQGIEFFETVNIGAIHQIIEKFVNDRINEYFDQFINTEKKQDLEILEKVTNLVDTLSKVNQTDCIPDIINKFLPINTNNSKLNRILINNSQTEESVNNNNEEELEMEYVNEPITLKGRRPKIVINDDIEPKTKCRDCPKLLTKKEFGFCKQIGESYKRCGECLENSREKDKQRKDDEKLQKCKGRCKQELSLSKFGINKRSKDYYKVCTVDRDHVYYIKYGIKRVNKDELQKTNPDKEICREEFCTSFLDTTDINKNTKTYFVSCLDCREIKRTYDKKRNIRDADKISLRKKTYYNIKKTEIREKQKDRYDEKSAEDIERKRVLRAKKKLIREIKV
jgi:hypothetical protein